MGKIIKSIEIYIRELELAVPALEMNFWNDIRVTNDKLSNETLAQELLKDNINYQSGIEEGKDIIKQHIKGLKDQLDKEAILLLSSMGIEF